MSESNRMLSRFGPYMLLDHLAQGGMADLYRARLASVEAIDRIFVIKKMHIDLAKKPGSKEMFEREIELTASIQHPNIVKLYDFRLEPEPFVALEYVHGKTLRDLANDLRQSGQRLPIKLALYVMKQICTGLHAAHVAKDPVTQQPIGLVHRDLSPSNVILGYDGTIKILDFGVAKATHSVDLTATGLVKGTPSYLSPEQVQAQKDLDARSDQFSVAVIFWEMVTGQRLFKADQPRETMARVLACETTVAPPSQINPEYLRDWDAVLLKAMRFDRARRYESVEEFIKVLESSFAPQITLTENTANEWVLFLERRYRAVRDKEAKELEELNLEAFELMYDATEMPELEVEKVATDIETLRRIASQVQLETPTVASAVGKNGSAGGIRDYLPGKLKRENDRGNPVSLLLVFLLCIGLGLGWNWFKNRVTPPELVEEQLIAPSIPEPALVGMQSLEIRVAPLTRDMTVQVGEGFAILRGGVFFAQIAEGAPVQIKVRSPQFTPFEQTLEYSALSVERRDFGDQRYVEAVLTPKTFGLLTLTTGVSGVAKVWFDKDPELFWTFATPVTDFKMLPGLYRMELSNPSLGVIKKKFFEIRNGTRVTLSEDLSQP